MKRLNLYEPGDILPTGAQWVSIDENRHVTFEPIDAMHVGCPVPDKQFAVTPTRTYQHKARRWSLRHQWPINKIVDLCV